MISITLDTSCLDLRYDELKDLEKLRKEGKIELWVELSTLIIQIRWNITIIDY
jgi:hypothetical protein